MFLCMFFTSEKSDERKLSSDWLICAKSMFSKRLQAKGVAAGNQDFMFAGQAKLGFYRGYDFIYAAVFGVLPGREDLTVSCL